MHEESRNEPSENVADVSPTFPQLEPNDPGVASLTAHMDAWVQARASMETFVTQHLVKGVDYGPIHISKSCETYKNTGACTSPRHWSKHVLFKAGSEKIVGFLQLRPTFERDNDTWEMLGHTAGILCYRCLLLTPSGEIVGEGRGARDVERDDRGDVNKAVKQCQKVAQTDAVLRVAGLSGIFIQDLEDMALRRDDTRGITPLPPHRHAGRMTVETSPDRPGPDPTTIDDALAREGALGVTHHAARLQREIWDIYTDVIAPRKHHGMHKAIVFHSFGLESPGQIQGQPDAILDKGMPLYRELTARLPGWDGQMHPDAWIAEQLRLIATHTLLPGTVPDGVSPVTGQGEDIGEKDEDTSAIAPHVFATAQERAAQQTRTE
jgi:hypothetical protein